MPAHHASEPARRDVLIVEDEPRMGRLLGQMMVELGYAATWARTGEEALERMQERPHPIAVLDLNLPGMGGMECLQRIREQWPDTEAIILTGFGDLDAAKRAIHLDVVEFLTKPCHLGDLEVALSRAEQRLRQHELDDLADRLRRQHEADQALGRPVADAPESGPSDDAEPPAESGSLNLKALERRAILDALNKHEGNREAAAAELGISVRTLYYRLREYEKKGLI
jgi:DNA-binding NtrC family response regulator